MLSVAISILQLYQYSQLSINCQWLSAQAYMYYGCYSYHTWPALQCRGGKAQQPMYTTASCKPHKLIVACCITAYQTLYHICPCYDVHNLFLPALCSYSYVLCLYINHIMPSLALYVLHVLKSISWIIFIGKKFWIKKFCH